MTMPPFANLLAALSAQGLHAVAPGASSGVASGAVQGALSGAAQAGRYDSADMASAAAPTGLPSLLVVDDEPELRGLLAEYFGRHGFAVRMAEGAAQARELIAAARPDLAVLDINMPGENGLSLARWLREAHPRVAIVMLTTASEAVDASSAWNWVPTTTWPSPTNCANCWPVCGRCCAVPRSPQQHR